MGKPPKKPAVDRPKRAKPFARPAAEEVAKRLPGIVSGLKDIQVGPTVYPPGSLLKKPKKAKGER